MEPQQNEGGGGDGSGLSIVVPAYNEARRLPGTLPRVIEYASRLGDSVPEPAREPQHVRIESESVEAPPAELLARGGPAEHLEPALAVVDDVLDHPRSVPGSRRAWLYAGTTMDSPEPSPPPPSFC